MPDTTTNSSGNSSVTTSEKTCCAEKELGEEAFWAAGIQEITGLEKIKSIGDRVLENTPVFEKYLTDGAGLFVQGHNPQLFPMYLEQ